MKARRRAGARLIALAAAGLPPMHLASNRKAPAIMRRSLSITATAVATAGLIILGATSAAAHVTVDADTTEGGSYAILTFGVPHGCGSSPTTRVSIQIPEQFSSVTPTVHPSWDVEVVMESLDTPVDDGHGGELTERASEVIYQADTPLPADQRDAFELSLRLPDTPGEVIAFPVVQTCEDGEHAWVQLPADGQDAGELAQPAPAITVTAADGGDAGAHGAVHPGSAANAEPPGSDGAGSDSAATETLPADSTAGAPAALTWVALALGAGGLLLGGLALARTRKV